MLSGKQTSTGVLFLARYIIPIMALWSAYVKINNRLQYVEHFESVSNFGSDAKVEAQGRFGTQEVQLFPKSK